MAEREILKTTPRNRLDGFFMQTGLKFGKLIKQCIDGALGSANRSAFNSDFLGVEPQTPAGTIAITPHADSAGTPAGTNAASDVTADYKPDSNAFTEPTIALTHNADPVSNLAAAALYAVEAQVGSQYLLSLQSTTNGNADVLGETADGLAGVAASCRFWVEDNDTPSGVQIYVNESESDRLEMISPTESIGYIIMPFESAAGGIPGACIRVKVYHSATADSGKPLYFDDNGAADAQLCFVDTGAAGGTIPAADVAVLYPDYITGAGKVGSAAAQVFTGSALATHSHASTAALTGTQESVANGFKFATTETGGTPVAGIKADGARGLVELYLDSTDEVQTARMDFGDQLCIDIDDEPFIEMKLQYTGTAAVASEAVFGLASAHNATLDTVAAAAWFKIVDDGTTTTLVCETDDSSNNNDDKATGVTLTEGTFYTFKIDLRNISDVKFYVNSQRVCQDITFDMSNYSDNLQPYIRVGKASGASEAKIEVDYVRGETNRD